MQNEVISVFKMAMVISQATKAAIGGFLALMILGAVLVVGAAFGWFDPRREDEDTPAKVSARLQGRTSYVTHRAVSITSFILVYKLLKLKAAQSSLKK